MSENDFRKKRIEIEEKQEEVIKISAVLEQERMECEQLFISERHHNERVATYFQRHEEATFFEDIIEDARIEERRYFEEMNEGRESLMKERSRLEDDSETLYEAELQALRTEAEVDG